MFRPRCYGLALSVLTVLSLGFPAYRPSRAPYAAAPGASMASPIEEGEEGQPGLRRGQAATRMRPCYKPCFSAAVLASPFLDQLDAYGHSNALPSAA